MRIDESGRCGSNGASGHHGGGYGGHGGRGADGSNGERARDILLTLAGSSTSCSLSGTHQGAISYGASAELFLRSVGGKGGDGGRGGDGSNGYPGSDGHDATRHSSGGNGSSGGPGGDGGNGGHGGDGGKGGCVRVLTDEKDMDLFMLVNQCDVSGGRKGSGGAGGDGGSGGRGGRGGSSYSWTTYSTDSNGYTTSHHHSNSGGSSGSSGSHGSSGCRGHDGFDGKDGRFSLAVRWNNGREDEFAWRYVARVTDLILHDLTTNDGVFEPGEHCRCSYAIMNSGSMPTPKIQRIFCSFAANQWLLSPTTSFVNRQLLSPSQVAELNVPIEYQVADTEEPAPNVVFCSSTEYVWDVHVERVGKFFTAGELGSAFHQTIQYPVRLSKTHGPATIALSEEAPLVICCHNLCSRALGRTAGRVLRVNLSLVVDPDTVFPFTNDNEASIVDADGNPIRSLDVPIGSLEAGMNAFPSIFVRFGPMMKVYGKVTVCAQLFLGHIRNFAAERRIQRMSVDIQMGAYYQSAPGCNILIVTSHATSRSAFLQWNDFATSKGLRPNFWNASLHDGLSLEQLVGSTSLATDFAHRTIVIENNDPHFLGALRSDRNAQNEFTFDTIPLHEISKSMRVGHTGIAILGRSVDVRWKLLPTDLEDVAIPAAEPFFQSCGTEYWLGRLGSCIGSTKEVREPLDFEAMHRFYEQEYDSTTAWQIVWGITVTNAGEPFETIRVQRPGSFRERLETYFSFYVPFVKSQTVDRLCACGRTEEVLIFAQLTAIFGPEIVLSNKYRVVFHTCRPKNMTEKNARKCLVEASNELYKEVSALRPMWKFVVMYEVAPHVNSGVLSANVCGVPIDVLSNGKRPFRKTYCIGRLFLCRAANRNDACISQCLLPLRQTIDADFIASQTVSYTILKAMPFKQKLDVATCAEFLSRAENGLVLSKAILSDIVEEQRAMRRVEWSGRLRERHLLEHCTMFLAFMGFGWSAKVLESGSRHQQLFLSIGVTLHVLLGRWTRWHDHFMFSRRWRVLSSLCLGVLDRALVRLAGGGCLKQQLRNEQQAHQEQTLEEYIAQCATGYTDDAKSSRNVELQFMSVSATIVDALRSREHPPHIVANRWIVDTTRDRRLMMHKLCCDFSSEGELKRKTSRDEQHSRLDFLHCKVASHTLREINHQDTCGICRDTVLVGGHRCDACNWNVCALCWETGNNARWNPQYDTDEGV